MRTALFIAVGFVLLVTNFWYLRSLYRTFFDTAMPDVIAPFQYVVVEDKDGVKGKAMARMLAARLASLQREVNEAEDALREVGPPPISRPTGSAVPLSPDVARPIQLNARVIDVPKLELKVSGVDVSGLFAWAYRGLAESRAIKVTVHSPTGAKTFTVAAHLDTPGLGDIWLTDVDASDLAVVEEVAMEILRKHTVRAKRIPEATGLDRKEFGSLIAALRKSASLNYKLRHGVEPTKSEYNAVVAELEPLVARTPRWRLLIELAAKAAENGRELSKALEYSKRQLALFDEEKRGKQLSEPERAERLAIEQRIAKLESAIQPATAPPAVATADVTAEYPLNLIALPRSVTPQGNPRVAILGGTPLPEQMKALGGMIETLAGDDEPDGASAMREHVGTTASVVRKVAPNATLVFTKMQSMNGSVSSGALLAALDQLNGKVPDVLLIPLRPLDESVAMVLDKMSGATVIVVPAGNEGPDQPPQFDPLPMASRILIAAAIDDKGSPAEFTSRSQSVVWAPGVNIPVTAVDSAGNLVHQTMSGTTFSAALAAGVAARLKGEKPELTPAAVIELVRRTSKPLVQDGPKVLQLDAALKATAE